MHMTMAQAMALALMENDHDLWPDGTGDVREDDGFVYVSTFSGHRFVVEATGNVAYQGKFNA